MVPLKPRARGGRESHTPLSLTHLSMDEGRFLVRTKDTGLDTYALSMVVQGKIVHHLLEKVDGYYRVNGKEVGRFGTLQELIHALRKER